ncbi:MAG TPA: hypothetical protein VKT26_03230 [Acetobacteraceae bacterium]|nr:hypothetical protein [Acetobacteraceae bacterium]
MFISPWRVTGLQDCRGCHDRKRRARLTPGVKLDDFIPFVTPDFPPLW